MHVQNGQIPKLSAIVDDSDSDEEPDAVVHIPINKVKLVRYCDSYLGSLLSDVEL